MKRRWVQRLAVSLAVVLTVGAILGVKALVAGRAALLQGVGLQLAADVAATAGDGESAWLLRESAADAYATAVGWYVPGSPYVTRGLERLWNLANLAEREGQPLRARMWVDKIRATLHSIRWLVQPHAYELQRCDAWLAELLVATDPRIGSGTFAYDRALARNTALIARAPEPRPGWSLAFALGLGLWLVATAALLKGWSSLGPPHRIRSRLIWGMLAAGGLGLWVCAWWRL